MTIFFARIISISSAITVVLSMLEVRRNGEPFSGSEFCNGDDLRITCSIGNLGIYAWTVSEIVMGNDGAAVVGLGIATRELNGTTYTLVATRDGQSSMSTLSFTVSDILSGRNITCGEAGQAPTESQVVNILGPPSAPSLSATGNTMFSSFNLNISHPDTSGLCVREYNLVVRQEGVVIYNNTFMRSSLQDDRFIDLMAIDNSLTVSTCNNTYTFELTPVGGSMSSGIQPGNPNFDAISSSSEQYRTQNGFVSWNDTDAFPNVPMECISGYQYSINGTDTSSISISMFNLNSSFTDSQICNTTTLTISPILSVGNSVLNNVVVTGDTCDRVKPQTKPTEGLATMQTTKLLQNSSVRSENIGALAAVTSVAALYFIISVIIIMTLAVVIKRLKLQLVHQEGQSHYEIATDKNELSSVNKKSDIGMVKCQAYGEVGVKNRAGSNEVNAEGVYEHI